MWQHVLCCFWGLLWLPLFHPLPYKLKRLPGREGLQGDFWPQGVSEINKYSSPLYKCKLRRQERESDSERESPSKAEITVFCTLIRAMTSHYSCILFMRISSYCQILAMRSSPNTRGGNHTKEQVPGGRRHRKLS